MASQVDVRGNKQIIAPGAPDSIGRTPVALSVSGNDLSYTVNDSNGHPQTSTVHLTPQTVLRTAFNQAGTQEYSQPRQLVSSVQLPNGQSYVFGYDSQGSGGSSQFGEVTSITLPTGARVDYVWG